MAGYPADSVTREDKHSFRIPKNIRQMGNIQGSVRIYMEDYVYTYLHTGRKEDSWNHKGCILLGNKFHENGQKYLFLSGLIKVKDENFKDGQPDFSDDVWGQVYREIKQYYEDVEILGWGMDVASTTTKITGELERIHRQIFSDGDKVIFLQNSMENEEAFYVNEKNALRRRDGYYIYYEKNPQMREYMLQSIPTQELQSEIDPQKEIIANYRTITQEKNKRAKSRWQRLAYAVCLVLIVGVSAIGVTMITGTPKLLNLKKAASAIETNAPHIESEVTPVANIVRVEQEEDDNQKETKPIETSGTQPEAFAQTQPADELSEESKDEEKVIEEQKEEPKVQGEEASEESEQEHETPKEETAEAEASGENTEQVVATAKENGYYIVKKGDSLLSISQKIYGEDCTEELCSLNKLDDVNKIYAGQKLLLLEE